MDRGFAIIFLLAGLLFIGFGAYSYISYAEFEKNAVEIEAGITNIKSERNGGNTSHTVYVSYYYKDEAYQNIRLNVYSSSMRVGKKTMILVNKDNPYSIMAKEDAHILEIGFALLGFLFAWIGGSGVVSEIKSNKRIKRRKANGERVIGTVLYLELDYSIIVDDTHPYKLVVEFTNPLNGEKEYTMSQSSFIFDDSWIGKSVYVYIDRVTMNKYVDYKEKRGIITH